MDHRRAQEETPDDDNYHNHNGDGNGDNDQAFPHFFNLGPLPQYIPTVLLHRPLPWDRCSRA